MLENRQVMLKDPTTETIPNGGVTKVFDPRTDEERAVLRYELGSFVCAGEYRNGLERVLSTYLAHLDKPEQPAVWVSGFFGSGKSHFVRVLEYLWRDVTFPDGARARGLANLPGEIGELLAELSTAGRREGGLWSAAGTLGAGAGSVRLALLAILLRSAGLPEQYAPARLVIWLRQNGYHDAARAGIEGRGRSVETELNNMYVSPILAQSLIDAIPGFAASAAEARGLLKEQYPNREEITDDELFRVMEDVLALQAATPGKLPCTLLVFDELQQFLGEDPARTLQVQNVVEAVSARFGSALLFVATGQAALQATPQLSKLQGRFTVLVTLEDADVERVVREVVLQKAPAGLPPLRRVLDEASGEIDRHLAGTRIGPVAADADALVADYPVLPVRRRFWERVLRAVDSAGTAGQLRTQLRIVHEATREVARKPLGTVVGGDRIYDQLKLNMQMSGVLLPDVTAMIAELDDGTADGKLRERLCATIFLIGKLPTDGIAATGVRATADALADLLTDDLRAGSAALRRRVPALLEGLVERGLLMRVDDEYRLQTRESAEWEQDFRRNFTRIAADDSRVASDRAAALREAIGRALNAREIKLTQGVSKTPRKFALHYGAEPPPVETDTVPVWVRDGWSATERAARDDAQAAGVESPLVTVYLPRQDADALKAALAGHAAARETLDARPAPPPEGQEARNAMGSRLDLERRKLDALLAGIVGNATVFQGGGNVVAEGALRAAVEAAIRDALVRLFPKFSLADHAGWDLARRRAGEGAADALTAVGHAGDVEKHPACQEIRAFIGGGGKKGQELRRHFTGVRYGWPQDAVDGALLALVAGGLVRATRNGQPLKPREITQATFGTTDFRGEGTTVSPLQRVKVRGLLADLGLTVKGGEEAEAIPVALERLLTLARDAGGDPPAPAAPDTAAIDDLRALGGNEQLVAVYERRDELLTDFRAWTQAKGQLAQRLPRWETLQRLLRHAYGLPAADEVAPQARAIETERALLAEPDPVQPLIGRLADALRAELQAARQRLAAAGEQELATLAATDEWQRLSEAQRGQLLRDQGLGPTPKLDLGSDDALVRALDAMPLIDWTDRTAALPARARRVREAAAQLLEPRAVTVRPRSATLKTPGEVEEYIRALEAEIMGHVQAGTPVIV